MREKVEKVRGGYDWYWIHPRKTSLRPSQTYLVMDEGKHPINQAIIKSKKSSWIPEATCGVPGQRNPTMALLGKNKYDWQIPQVSFLQSLGTPTNWRPSSHSWELFLRTAGGPALRNLIPSLKSYLKNLGLCPSCVRKPFGSSTSFPG